MLNKTPVKKTIILHCTNRLWLIVVSVTVWTLLTTGLTYLVIERNFGYNQQSCEVSEFTQPLPQNKVDNSLANKIKAVFGISFKKATNIADLATMHTSVGVFPSPEFVVAVMYAESSFKQSSTSPAGAKGIMQVMSYNSTGKDAYSNVFDGIMLLREYQGRLGSTEATLSAYNQGIGNYLKGKRSPEYVRKVMSKYKELKSA